MAGAMGFLRRHPVVCLLLLTPGIPEYLSGSSPISAILLDPPQFVFQLVANLGLYGPGVLLIREAMVRWNKGWGTVLLLGAAYGILEEGVALSTLFNPRAGPVGDLGFYGRWAGVNWIWVAAILPVHMIYSISVPILLLALAVPWTQGKRLLSRRKLPLVILILCADVASLFLIVLEGEGFWMGAPVLIFSLVAIGLLVLAAKLVPPGVLMARTLRPLRSPRTLAMVGAVFYPSVLVLDGLSDFYRIDSLLSFIFTILLQALYLAFVVRSIGSIGRERQAIALVLGLLVPIMAIGLVSQVVLPLVVLADAGTVLFLREVWASYPTRSGLTSADGPVSQEKGLSEI